jgi:hypothetical protein
VCCPRRGSSVAREALGLPPPIEHRFWLELLASLLPAEHVSRAWHGIDAGYVVRDGVDALHVFLDVPLCFMPQAAMLHAVPVGAEFEADLFPPLGDPELLT